MGVLNMKRSFNMIFSLTILSLCLVSSAFAEVLFLGLGYNNIDYTYRTNIDTVNIDHDLDSYGSYCSPLPNYPLSVGGAAGGLVNDRIVICGGSEDGEKAVSAHRECLASTSTGWEVIGNLIRPKSRHAAANLPNGGLWMTGGQYSENDFHSTDFVTTNMEVIRGPNLPTPKHGHCLTQFNSTTMMFIGGFENAYRVDFFNVDTQQWFNFGPETNFPHRYSGCVSFTDSDGKEKVMVIGDNYSYDDDINAEIFDGVSWEILENPPVTMSNVEAVLYKDKVIVTGEDHYSDPFPTSWEFDINTRTWAPGFTMNPPIYDHITFLLPDSFCK